jgi:hypothetical protein
MPVLTAQTTANCPHGAPTTFIATGAKVLVMGAPAFLQGDQAPIAGCPFTVPPGKPQPCIKVLFSMPSAKVSSMGKPLMLRGPADMGQSPEQAPQGPLIYGGLQTKVIAT